MNGLEIFSMIDNQCLIYVLNKGFIKTEFVAPGDRVYTLGLDAKVSIEEVESIQSDFFYGKINVIDSGQHNVNSTDSSLHLYTSEQYGVKYLKFLEIPAKTPDKEYRSSKYLPLLSTPFFAGKRSNSDQELEYIARMLVSEQYDISSFNSIVSRCTGEDALVLVDLLEFWLSDDPGKGWLGRAQVKARAHEIKNEYIADEILKIACLAGYTSKKTCIRDGKSWLVFINYESTPVPGSRPKNEKYYKQSYFGSVYQINANSKSILGISKGRCFYLPCASVL